MSCLLEDKDVLILGESLALGFSHKIAILRFPLASRGMIQLTIIRAHSQLLGA